MYLVLQSYKINTYICTHNKTFYKAYTKMYKSRQIADWIIHKTHGNITHSKLQKLLYYCQAWHYTIFNEVLFDERIEAWAHGPVVPSQFSRFNNIDFFQNIKVKDCENIKLKSKTEQLLNEVVGIYNKCTDRHLELLVKREVPWRETRGNIPEFKKCQKEIQLDLMKQYYININ